MTFLQTFRARSLVALATLGLATACSPQEEITGQVFLLDEDDSPKPLALVDIKFFDREEADQFLTRQYSEWQEDQLSLKAKIQETRSDLSFQRVMVRELQNDLQNLENRVAQQRERIRENYSEKITPFRRAMDRNNNLIDNMETGPTRPSGPVPSAREWERYQDDLERWQSKTSSEREEWLSQLKAANADMKEQIEALEEQRDAEIGEWEDRLASTRETLEERRELVDKFETQIENLENEVDNPPSISSVIRRMGEPEFQTQSDANGNFALSLPSRERFALAARARRSIKDNEQDHAWIFWINPREQAGQRLLLTGQNSLHGQTLGEWGE